LACGGRKGAIGRIATLIGEKQGLAMWLGKEGTVATAFLRN